MIRLFTEGWACVLAEWGVPVAYGGRPGRRHASFWQRARGQHAALQEPRYSSTPSQGLHHRGRRGRAHHHPRGPPLQPPTHAGGAPLSTFQWWQCGWWQCWWWWWQRQREWWWVDGCGAARAEGTLSLTHQALHQFW